MRLLVGWWCGLAASLLGAPCLDAAPRAIAIGQEIEAVFDVASDAEPGELAHRWKLPESRSAVPWRVVIQQEGIDVRIAAVVGLDSPSASAGQADRAWINSYLDRYEEEILRFEPSVREIEIRPVVGGERRGTYRLRLEQPLAEAENRLRLERLMTEAASIEHGSAAPALRRAAEIYEKIAEEMAGWTDISKSVYGSVLRARALLGAANHWRVLGVGERAQASYRESASIWRLLGEDGWLAASLVGVGQSARRLGQLEAARSALEEALELWRSLPGRATEESQTESNLGLVAHVAGDYPRAIDHYRVALDHHEATGRDREIANISLNLGSVFSRLGDAEAALDYQSSSLERFRQLKDRRGELDALNSLARLHGQMADLEAALGLFGESRRLAAELGDRRLEGRALNNRGWIYLGLGQFERAVADCELGLKLSRESQDALVEMAAASNLGWAHFHLGEYAQARLYLREALETAKERDHGKQIELLAQLGRLESRLGEGDGADELSAAWALHRRRGTGWDEALLSTIEGETLAHLDASKSLASLAQAREAWRSLDNEFGEIVVLSRLGHSQRRLGRLVEARLTLREALERIESFRGEMTSLSLRAAFLAPRLEIHALLIEVLVDLAVVQPGAGYLEEAFLVSEEARGRHRLDSLEQYRSSAGEEVEADSALLGERRSLGRRLALLVRRQQLMKLGRQRPIDGDDVALSISDVRAKLDILDARLRKRWPRREMLNAPGSLDIADIAALLDEETVLLSYSLGEERSHAWVLDRRGLRHHESLAPRGEIELAARRLHLAWSTVGNDSSSLGRGEDQEAALALSRLVIEPVAEKLGEHGRLAVLLDGALHYVPFAALPWPVEGKSAVERGGAQILVERFELARLASASVLATERRLESAELETASSRRSSPRFRLTVFADPVFDRDDPRLVEHYRRGERSLGPRIAMVRGVQRGSAVVERPDRFGRLPGSAVEAQVISSHLPVPERHLALGFEAHRGVLWEQASRSTIVHFATHGVIDSQDPELSGLVLSQFHPDGRRRPEGFLRLHDLEGLRLDAELVVLSGCRTALGKELRGEAFQGLASAFLQAGARRVMASLWAVPDRATAELMAHFYEALWLEGFAPAAALRRAQLEMSKDRRYADPYFWAGFVVQGDWLADKDLRVDSTTSPEGTP